MRCGLVCTYLVNIEISNDISSFASGTSGVVSADSFLQNAFLIDKPNLNKGKLTQNGKLRGMFL